MDFNLMQMIFLSSTALVAGLGLSTTVLEKYVPIFIAKTFRYGKYAVTEDSFVSKVEFPKRSVNQDNFLIFLL